jgi:general secretion pathway protein J
MMRKMRQITHGGSRGFTLLEILLAIFILSVVLTTIYTSYTGTLRLFSATRYDDDIYGMARSTMKRMVADLESICTYEESFIFISEGNEFNVEEFTNLTFLTSAHLDFFDEGSAGIAMVRYYVVEEEGEGGGFVLKRSDVLYRGDEEEEREGFGFVLCDRLKSVKYKFYDGKGGEFDAWSSSSALAPEKDGAPALIAINLEFVNPEDSDRPYRFRTEVFLPMAGAR